MSICVCLNKVTGNTNVFRSIEIRWYNLINTNTLVSSPVFGRFTYRFTFTWNNKLLVSVGDTNTEN